MKKLKLKALELGASELLTRQQLKNVMGGSGSGGSTCEVSVNCYRTVYQNGQWVEIANGTIKCTSDTGNCTHSTTSISCDGKTISC
jgi:hypothetical protein